MKTLFLLLTISLFLLHQLNNPTSSYNYKHNTMASTNPSNFANLPKDELREIAAKGGHASHGASDNTSSGAQPDRNPDGTFTKGSELAKELGAKGGHVAHEHHAQADDGVSTR